MTYKAGRLSTVSGLGGLVFTVLGFRVGTLRIRVGASPDWGLGFKVKAEGSWV